MFGKSSCNSSHSMRFYLICFAPQDLQKLKEKVDILNLVLKILSAWQKQKFSIPMEICVSDMKVHADSDSSLGFRKSDCISIMHLIFCAQNSSYSSKSYVCKLGVFSDNVFSFFFFYLSFFLFLSLLTNFPRDHISFKVNNQFPSSMMSVDGYSKIMCKYTLEVHVGK